MKGVIFDIQRCSIGDGPGIRTNVFLKGCPLRCLWCHNPEGWRAVPQLRFDARKCQGCGACARVCPHGCHGGETLDRAHCEACGKCAAVCQGRALEICGRYAEPEEVLAVVERDRPFYESSGGGMTLSGGEPLMQPEFSLALLRGAAERKIDACLETSGYGSFDWLSAMAPYVSCFLYDVKETDAKRHEAFTGVSNERILENLRALNTLEAKIILRCPIIPGCNDRPDHFAALGSLAQSLERVQMIHVEPYHPLGMDKRRQFGMEEQQPFPLPTAEQADQWVRAIQAATDKPVRIA